MDTLFVSIIQQTVLRKAIAIDPSGYSLVTSGSSWVSDGSLSVYDPSGREIHSVRGQFSRSPRAVSVSPDGSVWVTDTYNNRLLKY